jgi:hypothetical protein
MMPPPPVPPKALKQSQAKIPIQTNSFERPPSTSTPPPSLTQSNPSRRRTLGMTRTTIQTSAVSHSILPAKRKQFKSPLIKQEPDCPSLADLRDPSPGRIPYRRLRPTLNPPIPPRNPPRPSLPRNLPNRRRAIRRRSLISPMTRIRVMTFRHPRLTGMSSTR